jgi:hypothetical protein
VQALIWPETWLLRLRFEKFVEIIAALNMKWYLFEPIYPAQTPVSVRPIPGPIVLQYFSGALAASRMF